MGRILQVQWWLRDRINSSAKQTQGCLGGGPRGSAPLVLKTVCRGPQGAFNPCERLHFRAKVLKLGGVKSLLGGREHSSG